MEVRSMVSGRTRGPQLRKWVTAALAAVTGGLLLLTLVSREWIELIFGVDPDNGDGTLEWIVVGGLTVAFGALVPTALVARRATREEAP
jgi:O-antigen/teichoic acid export membrane protein